jgi:hypothetical protein
VKFALRWEPSWRPLFVETELAFDNAPGVHIAHTSGGLALGARWPRGAIRPYAFGELGLTGARQPTLGGGIALATGGYLGAGLGVHVDFRRWFLLADARWRWLSTGRWENGDPPKPALVRLTDPDTQALIVGAAAGYRF